MRTFGKQLAVGGKLKTHSGDRGCMENLLFGLTPGEWWVWSYLVHLAHKQGSTAITLPRPGEDAGLEARFSRRHLRNLLNGLKAKRTLTKLLIPRSKSNQIQVILPASLVGDPENAGLGKSSSPMPTEAELHFPNNGSLGKSSSPMSTLGKSSSPMLGPGEAGQPGESGGLGKCSSPMRPRQLSLKALVIKKAKALGLEITKLTAVEVAVLRGQAKKAPGYREPRGRKLLEQAKLYAEVRFLQESTEKTINRPQAWIDTVAREYQAELAGEGGGPARAGTLLDGRGRGP